METKSCSKCKIEKIVSDFYKRSAKEDGLMQHCKACHIIPCNPPIQVGTKTCSKCELVKHPQDFGLRAASYDGLQPMCRVCKKNVDKVEAQTRKEKRSAYQKTYYANKIGKGL